MKYYKIVAIFRTTITIILCMLLPNIIFYLIGSFVAMDWNFLNWIIFKYPFGRGLVAALDISFLTTVPFTSEMLDL